MNWRRRLREPGVLAAFGAALLFGCGTPLAKTLLSGVNSWLMAGLLYIGSGLGLTLYRGIRRASSVRLPPNEMAWFAGAVIAGGVVGPLAIHMFTSLRLSIVRSKVSKMRLFMRFSFPTDCRGYLCESMMNVC
jgi:drug/metabolite transporter (DMT)-like permease